MIAAIIAISFRLLSPDPILSFAHSAKAEKPHQDYKAAKFVCMGTFVPAAAHRENIFSAKNEHAKRRTASRRAMNHVASNSRNIPEGNQEGGKSAHRDEFWPAHSEVINHRQISAAN